MTEINPGEFAAKAQEIESAIGRVIVGQKEVIRQVLISIVAGGHVLLEGVPGLGKTMLVRTIGEILRLRFQRIQFTPDLMPADIVGTQILATSQEGREFRFQPGPVFANLVLADEINRATPKTQSALLEAMQEKTVTVGSATRPLPQPFFVLATQNPLEQEGTYPLPEAQLDRFFFKILVHFPGREELHAIIERTTGNSLINLEPVATGEEILTMGALAAQVPVARHVSDYAVRLLLATHPDNEYAPEKLRRLIKCGASPRGLQTMIQAAKIRALLEGRFNVAFEDIRQMALGALRHRIFLNFEGEAAGVTTDDLVREILTTLPEDA